jgi:hypothetical protein
MSDGQITADDHGYSEAGSDLVRALPPWMPKDKGSGNFALLDVIGRSIDDLDADLSQVDSESKIQYASHKGSIEQIGDPFGTISKTDEPVEKFRLRTFTEYQSITSEGTINGLLNRVGGLLDVDPSVITYDELAANIKVGIPSKAANNLPLSVAEFSANLNLLIPAGYKLDLIMLGTFTYITPTQYTDGLSEVQYGYDGLDTNGDPKDNGGTYAAVLD